MTAKRDAGDHRDDRAEGHDSRPSKLTLARETASENKLWTAIGAAGLGALAYTVVTTLFGRDRGQQQPRNTPATAPGHDGRLAAVPLAAEANAETPAAGPRHDLEPASRPAGVMPRPDPVPADRSAETAEHRPTDLMGDPPPTANDRAINAFRPDPTAPVPDAMRDSLRPATGPAPSLSGNRGDFAQGLSQADESK